VEAFRAEGGAALPEPAGTFEEKGYAVELGSRRSPVSAAGFVVSVGDGRGLLVDVPRLTERDGFVHLQVVGWSEGAPRPRVYAGLVLDFSGCNAGSLVLGPPHVAEEIRLVRPKDAS
jgi:hypothetical protein